MGREPDRVGIYTDRAVGSWAFIGDLYNTSLDSGKDEYGGHLVNDCALHSSLVCKQFDCAACGHQVQNKIGRRKFPNFLCFCC